MRAVSKGLSGQVHQEKAGDALFLVCRAFEPGKIIRDLILEGLAIQCKTVWDLFGKH